MRENRAGKELRGAYGPGKGTGGGRRSDERGFVLLVVMIIIVGLLIIGLAANRNAITDAAIASNHGGNTKVFYAAEAEGEYAFNQLILYLPGTQTMSAAAVLPASIANPVVPAGIQLAGYTFTNPVPTVTAVGVPVQRAAPAPYTNLQSYMQTYRIQVGLTDTNTNVTNTVSMDVNCQLVPLFEWILFYNGDLELNPGAAMTIGTKGVKGMVHTNGNLYTSPAATEDIYAQLTIAGQLVHSRAPGDTSGNGSGAVNIGNSTSESNTTALGTTGSATLNGSTLTANKLWGTTTTGTEATWNGNIQTSAPTITLPLGISSSNPEDITSGPTTTGSMGSKASLFLTNGVATDVAGNKLSTCYYNASHKNSGGLIVDSGCSAGANQNSVTTGTVYDYREGKTAETTDIDVNQFQNTPAGRYLANPTNGGDAGLLYTTSTNSTSSSQFNAVRLTDGTTLTSPLTVATPLPVYVEGNDTHHQSEHW